MSGGPSADGEEQAPTAPKRSRWWQRESNRNVRKRAAGRESAVVSRIDQRENDDTRLPASESVHLAGLVLTEVFTPSTVSSLYRTLQGWPARSIDRRQELLEALSESRAGARGGWRDLGLVRPPGGFVMGDGCHDARLPRGIEAVWLRLVFETPTVTVVVATFTLSEQAGDLSLLLRRDYQRRALDTTITVSGLLAAMRARIPWGRPRWRSVSSRISTPADEKRRACEALISKEEDACREWMSAKFPGRFQQARAEQRPSMRILLTQETEPFSEERWLDPLGLRSHPYVWRSTEEPGWWLNEERWPRRDRRQVMTLAARRSDVARDPDQDEEQDSNWYLTQRFASDQSLLASRHAVLVLLSLYADRLSELRDQAGAKRHFLKRPVGDARVLDDFLIGDGLDATTVSSDLQEATGDLQRFRWDVPEFVESTERLQPLLADVEPRQFVVVLCDEIRNRAQRLIEDVEKATQSIRASAELRQAIANTTLQRRVLALSVVAIVIALISLLTAR